MYPDTKAKSFASYVINKELKFITWYNGNTITPPQVLFIKLYGLCLHVIHIFS